MKNKPSLDLNLALGIRCGVLLTLLRRFYTKSSLKRINGSQQNHNTQQFTDYIKNKP